jgi:hypothetical protein
VIKGGNCRKPKGFQARSRQKAISCEPFDLTPGSAVKAKVPIETAAGTERSNILQKAFEESPVAFK